MRHDHAAAAGSGEPSHHGTTAFNVTEVVQKLQGSGGLSQQATVTLIPSGTLRADARPVIAQVQLVEK